MKSDVILIVTAFVGGCLLVSFFLFSGFRPPLRELLSDRLSSNNAIVQKFVFSGLHHPSQDPAFNLSLNPNKKFVILLASFRSGSTFLGKLFDSNPTMQYLFEPFYDAQIRTLWKQNALFGARPDHKESDLRMLYLQQIMHNCTVFPTPFRETHEWCGTEEENLHRFNTTRCVERIWGKYASAQQEICRYRNTTVIKVIRLADLRDILKIAQIRSADVQIIQLIRHPVAVMMSRRIGGGFFIWDRRTQLEASFANYHVEKHLRRTKLAWEAFNYCYDNLKAMKLVESDPWLKDRYLRLSHYEMSLHPLESAEKVYSFIGTALTDHIREFIHNITGAESKGFKNAPKLALNVFKNSTDIVTNWMNKVSVSRTLQYRDVFSIEAQCKQMFSPLMQEFSVDSIANSKLLRINAALSDLDSKIDL